MAYIVEWNPLLENDEVKRTLAKLHVTFMTIGVMSITNVLKIIVTSDGAAEVYAKNGYVYSYRATDKYTDRLERVEAKRI